MRTFHALVIAAAVCVLAAVVLQHREAAAPRVAGTDLGRSHERQRVDDAPPTPASPGERAANFGATDIPGRLVETAASPEGSDRMLILLRHWASTDAPAAARWAVGQESVPLDVALAAIFDAIAGNPAAAEALARSLAHQFPELAPDIGAHLVAALGRAGAHSAAAEFARGEEGSTGQAWTTTAFFEWGRANPAQAIPALDDITDADRRHAAFQALVSGWAKQDPRRLLDAYPTFPPGWDQRFAVVTALRAWIQRDPAAAAAWIERAKLPFDPDWDLVLAE